MSVVQMTRLSGLEIPTKGSRYFTRSKLAPLRNGIPSPTWLLSPRVPKWQWVPKTGTYSSMTLRAESCCLERRSIWAEWRAWIGWGTKSLHVHPICASTYLKCDS